MAASVVIMAVLLAIMAVALTTMAVGRLRRPFFPRLPRVGRGELRYLPTGLLRNVQYWASVWWAVSLRTCYALSGTDLAFAKRYLVLVASPYALATRCL
eukprot:1305572-Rhodomonas_salina.1